MKRHYLKYYLAALVSLSAFTVYLPSLRNDFVNWDDNLNVYDNTHIRSFGTDFFNWAFFNLSGVDYWRPLTWISHAVDYAVWGLNPVGHHLTNNILHALNTFLVVLLVVRLMESRLAGKMTSPEDGRFALIAAVATGLLFGLHPLQVESVAWVSERKNLLYALFFVLSIMMYLKYGVESSSCPHDVQCRHSRESRGPYSKKYPGQRFFSKHYILSLLFFVLALMSKPMAVSLPVVLLILDWYPLERARSLRSFWNVCIEKLPFVALTLASSVLTILAQKSRGTIRSLEHSPFSVRLFIAVKSLGAYLWKMLLPSNLLPYYPYPRMVQVLSLEYLLPVIFVIGITIASVVIVKKQKLWLSMWGYYVITLLPVIGLVRVGSQEMADRYAYLPCLGPFLIIGLGTAWIWEKAGTWKRWVAIVRTIIAVIFISTFVCVSYLTVKQLGIWKNSFTLWTRVIEKEPNAAIAYENRAAYFYNLHQFDKAVPDYDMLLSLEPFNDRAYVLRMVSVEALFDRGNFYLRQGNKELAVLDFKNACKYGKESACAALKGAGIEMVLPK